MKGRKDTKGRKKKPEKKQGAVTNLSLLRAKRRPGPAGSDVPDPGDLALAQAAQVLRLIDEGILPLDRSSADHEIPVDGYGRALRRLTAADELELATRIQTYGDVDARNTLVLANLGLVHLVANQLRRPSIRYEDLVQEGVIGLIRATETYEPNRGIRFSTYSVYWIRAKVQRFLQKVDREDIPNITGASLAENEDGRRRRPRARKVSLDQLVDPSEGRTIADLLKNDDVGPEDATLNKERKRRVKKVLRDIALESGDPRLLSIIHQRLLNEEPETLTALGQRLNLSREGARLLENKILRLAKEKLRELKRTA